LTELRADASLLIPSRQLWASRAQRVGWVCGTGYQPQSRIKFLSMDIVHQLGELFLGAVPTVVLVLIFYFILKSLFFKPLLAVMAEREARSIGAQKAAEAAQAAAAEKVKQYQDALRQARAQVYAEQETARKKLLDERAELLKDARVKGNAEVAAAKERVAAELTAARREMEPGIAQLAAEIAKRVLQPAREAR
jgi:F-type H+-transporting ATPase subunit b